MRTPELHPLDCKKLYEEYYLHQTGRGMAAFTGARYQRGHGLGNMLRSLTKFAIPFLKKGAKAVSKQAMKTGMNIAQEVMLGQNINKEAMWLYAELFLGIWNVQKCQNVQILKLLGVLCRNK